jgi:hypothetical protein
MALNTESAVEMIDIASSLPRLTATDGALPRPTAARLVFRCKKKKG